MPFLTTQQTTRRVFSERWKHCVQAAHSEFHRVVLASRTFGVVHDRVVLQGAGRSTFLIAAADNSTLLYFHGSDGGVRGLTLSSGGRGHITALAVVPREGILPARRQNQNFNRFSDLLIEGVDEGIVLQAGPRVGGGDSGCWYNVFDSIHLRFVHRGIWLQDPPNAASSVNRNQFYSVRIGQAVNTGIQIDAGDTNTFFGCSFEGISAYETPNTVPTAIVLRASSRWGTTAQSYRFFGCSFEGNTRDVENNNRYTEFYGSTIHRVRSDTGHFGPVRPAWILGNDPSHSPTLLPGLLHAEGSMIGQDNGQGFSISAGDFSCR